MKEKIHKLLRWSEKYTKTDMVYLAKGGFWLMLGQIVTSLSGLLIAISFANLLPPDVYGKYKFVLSVISIISIATLPGINTALTRSVAQGFNNAIITATKTRIRWGYISSLLSIFISLYYLINNNTELFAVFLTSSFFLPFLDSFNTYQAILNGKKDFRLSTKYQIISQLFSFTFMFLTIIKTHNLILILLSYFIPWTVARLFFYKMTYKRYHIDKAQDEDVNLIPYGKHLTAMSTLSIVSSHFDKIILFHFLGAAQLAFYTFATVIPEQIKSVFTKVSTLAFPKFSEKSKEEIKLTIWRKIVILNILLIFISLIYILFAPLIFQILFPVYIESVVLSQFFALSLFTISLYIPLDIMKALRKTKELYKFNIVTSVIKIILSLIFIYLYGLPGAIVAWMTYRVISFIYAFTLLHKILKA